ncbi:MAG TPA: DinB family protein [Terriglobales bacterium]|jgi:uncharacterized damage-inducible protein DinB|nr:DinB family protein [Terriglobales bacterium]
MNKGAFSLPEPWLRGTLSEIPAVQRAVLHALALAKEDVIRWCGDLSDEQMHAKPNGLASVAFHLRHIVRSCDRLLTYAEGRELSNTQMAGLDCEMDAPGMAKSIFSEFEAGLASAAERVKNFDPSLLEQSRIVGRKGFATTLGGLLVHIADHTQRHVGQAITTAKILTSPTNALHDS